jgi:hypothetical protein
LATSALAVTMRSAFLDSTDLPPELRAPVRPLGATATTLASRVLILADCALLRDVPLEVAIATVNLPLLRPDRPSVADLAVLFRSPEARRAVDESD